MTLRKQCKKKRKYLDTWLSHITELSGLDISNTARVISKDAEYNNARMVRLSKPLFRQGKTYKTPAGGTYTYLRGKLQLGHLILTKKSWML